ncbi:hypothetical protein ACIRH0_04195 [Streptomyces sp. NPDC093675]|uniref:hypothetical protein n=1 Tax=Streptomyces sp. NPDC093675 TaxID=3366049 RepID=UPI0037F17081
MDQDRHPLSELVAATAGLIATNPRNRLALRSTLGELAGHVRTVAVYFGQRPNRERQAVTALHSALDRTRSFLRHAEDLEPLLDRAVELSQAIYADYDLHRAFALDSANELESTLTNALDLAETLALDPILTSALNLDHALAAAQQVVFELGPSADYGPVYLLIGELAHALRQASLPDVAVRLARDLGTEVRRLTPLPEYDREIVQLLLLAHTNLRDAANDFRGADLTGLKNIVEFDLDGIRWDRKTLWPSSSWKERMQVTSVEDPPGSGIFVVQADRGHHYASDGPLTPTS